MHSIYQGIVLFYIRGKEKWCARSLDPKSPDLTSWNALFFATKEAANKTRVWFIDGKSVQGVPNSLYRMGARKKQAVVSLAFWRQSTPRRDSSPAPLSSIVFHVISGLCKESLVCYIRYTKLLHVKSVSCNICLAAQKNPLPSTKHNRQQNALNRTACSYPQTKASCVCQRMQSLRLAFVYICSRQHSVLWAVFCLIFYIAFAKVSRRGREVSCVKIEVRWFLHKCLFLVLCGVCEPIPLFVFLLKMDIKKPT